MTIGQPVTASIHVDAPPERVFSFFVEPEALCTWLARWAEVDPRPGGRFAVDVEGTPVRGEVLEIEPGRRLVLSWGHAGSDRLPPGSSTVEVTFAAEDGGTRVDLVHRGLSEAEARRHAEGWRVLFARLGGLSAEPT